MFGSHTSENHTTTSGRHDTQIYKEPPQMIGRTSMIDTQEHWVSLTTGLLLATCLLVTVPGGPLKGQDLSPFVIPEAIDPQYDIWIDGYSPIEPDSERVIASGSQFTYRGKLLRIWGVNLSFGANFPAHKDAARVAQRLAAAGVNSVRCHHMDTSRWPRGIWNAKDGRTIEPEALDRLDYFINALARHGIYTNINLHVGRAHSQYLGLPETNRQYDKISGIFTPALVAAQRQFARDLLTHVNPYRKVRYADDPAVAFVEITNEDSFFMWSSDQTLRTLPDYYAKILRSQFNQWLNHRYRGDQHALATAWAEGVEPLGENLLTNGDFSRWEKSNQSPPQWHLEQHAGCRASVSKSGHAGTNAIAIEIGKADGTGWHLQLTQAHLAVQQGRYYTITFQARSDRPRQIDCSIGQAHEPWRNLGLSRKLDLTPQWKRFSFGFVTTDADDNARISFALGGDTGGVYLSDISVCPGGQVALAEGESLEKANIELFQNNESHARMRDRMIFLAETEKAYFDDMRSYIKNDLKCGALVTGTIVFGPLGLYAQSDMDFIDAHAYWQHPRFPGRPWDQGNWLINQKPMTDHIDEATLFGLAAERLAGKPFTVSEYNHPAPLDSQAECVPMLASFAAAQGWNGLWFYTYSHSGDTWDREHMNSFFDIDTNPAKWGFMRAGASIFRDGKIGSLKPVTETVGSRRQLGELADDHLRYDTGMFGLLQDVAGVTRSSVLRRAIIPRYEDTPARPEQQHTSIPRVSWSVDSAGRGLYQATGSVAQIYTGHAARFAQATDGDIAVTSPEFAALTITPLDGDEDDAPQKLLVTACGRCENTGMQFSEDRQTVGRNWGDAPVRIEPVEGKLRLPEGRWICHALAADGSPKQEIRLSRDGKGEILEMSEQYGTMWYLLER